MPRTGSGEWLWRFIAVTMLFAAGWLFWVLNQLSPAPLVLDSAFRAAAQAKASGTIAEKSSSRGVIAPAAAAPSAPPAAPPPAVTTPAAATPSSEEVFEAVESWARAWSSKDVDAYLAAYAADFKTPQGEPRAAWEKVRRQRIASPKSITVTIDGPKMTVVAPDRVQVDFNQLYRSDIVSTSLTTKTLVLVKADGRWRIQQEIATN